MSNPLTPAQLTALINSEITTNGVGAITGAILNNVLQNIVGLLANAFTFAEPLTVTATNTLSALSNAPSSALVLLAINGQVISSVSSPAPFTISGMTVTWNAANAGFSLQTGYNVVAIYSL